MNILQISCSEYVNHISLSDEELNVVIKIMHELEYSSGDIEHIIEHFHPIPECPLDTTSTTGIYLNIEGISFIEEDICEMYEHLRDIILEMRDK